VLPLPDASHQKSRSPGRSSQYLRFPVVFPSPALYRGKKRRQQCPPGHRRPLCRATVCGAGQCHVYRLLQGFLQRRAVPVRGRSGRDTTTPAVSAGGSDKPLMVVGKASGQRVVFPKGPVFSLRSVAGLAGVNRDYPESKPDPYTLRSGQIQLRPVADPGRCRICRPARR